MAGIEKFPKAAQSGGREPQTIEEFRRRLAELTEANAALRQQVEELADYKAAISPIIFSLLNNPFADMDWLRHKARKATRPPKP